MAEEIITDFQLLTNQAGYTIMTTSVRATVADRVNQVWVKLGSGPGLNLQGILRLYILTDNYLTLI
jgi:hypothetical protein